jgi:hypothetical protein
MLCLRILKRLESCEIYLRGEPYNYTTRTKS